MASAMGGTLSAIALLESKFWAQLSPFDIFRMMASNKIISIAPCLEGVIDNIKMYTCAKRGFPLEFGELIIK